MPICKLIFAAQIAANTLIGLALAAPVAAAPRSGLGASVVTTSLDVPSPHRVHARSGPLKQARTALAELKTAPFPFNGLVPSTNRPFINVSGAARRGHRTGHGRVLWEDQTFADRRVLLHIPQGFDVRKPCIMVLFFHGHGATLERDVYARQQVAAQISASGANAILVAPQFAVDAADSSAGKFWQPGGVARFLAEAADQLAKLHGNPKSRATFASMPVVLVAYSGGFAPAAWSLRHGGIDARLRGVVMLDALYGEVDQFADWILTNRRGFFVSSYTRSTEGHHRELHATLAKNALAVRADLGRPLRPGSIAFLAPAPDVTHRDFVTHAWAPNPIADVLVRIKGYRR